MMAAAPRCGDRWGGTKACFRFEIVRFLIRAKETQWWLGHDTQYSGLRSCNMVVIMLNITRPGLNINDRIQKLFDLIWFKAELILLPEASSQGGTYR